MFVNFQIIHSFKNVEDLKYFIEETLVPINQSIIKKHVCEYTSGKQGKPIKCYIKKNIIHHRCIAIIELCMQEFLEDYAQDGYSTIQMGFEWGAGEVFNELNKYIYEFAKKIKKYENIFY